MAKKATPETRQSVVGVIASFMQVKNFSPEDINALRKHLGSLQDIEEFRAQASRLFGKIVKISGGKSP